MDEKFSQIFAFKKNYFDFGHLCHNAIITMDDQMMSIKFSCQFLNTYNSSKMALI